MRRSVIGSFGLLSQECEKPAEEENDLRGISS